MVILSFFPMNGTTWCPGGAVKCRDIGYGSSGFQTPSALISQTSSVFSFHRIEDFFGGGGKEPTAQLFTRNSATIVDSSFIFGSLGFRLFGSDRHSPLTGLKFVR